PDSRKIGHVRPESSVTMNRNARSRSSGIVGHDGPEYPANGVVAARGSPDKEQYRGQTHFEHTT
ncbi:hypothetical protein, partial [Cupriavidus numazuensis]|uniref:hypothetical protein n=1 Tax=Cupriavidus numazuensis TaxID=221992 RepID=UPI001BAC4D69